MPLSFAKELQIAGYALPKNTVNAFAKEAGDAVREPESFGIALAKHFVDDIPQVSRCRLCLQILFSKLLFSMWAALYGQTDSRASSEHRG